MTKKVILIMVGILLFGCAHHEKAPVYEQPIPEVPPSKMEVSRETVTSG
jgi:hypothetical protein